jgi:formamidase
MRRIVIVAIASVLLAGGIGSARADTSSATWQTRVVVSKKGDRCVDDPNCFNRLHPAIPPIAHAKPGDFIIFATRDAIDSGLNLSSMAADVAALDLNLVHPYTGPVHVEGAKRGDVLAITLVDIEPDEYGYTVIVPGFGFLRDHYTKPFIVNWKLSRSHAVSDQMPRVRVPFNGFMGSVGVLPGEPEVKQWLARETELGAAGGVALPPQPIGAVPAAVCGPNGRAKDECLRTIPPRENGGNMDVKQMQVGTTLLVPCYIDGCGLFVGDVHYAQGDGEVSGTAIEMGGRVTVTTRILAGKASEIKSPQFHGGGQLKTLAPSKFHATIGLPTKQKGEIPPQLTYIKSDKIEGLQNLSEDLTLAARNALLEMIDYLVRHHELSREQAYVLCSVAVDLHISQVVDVPNYVVTAILDLGVFENQ